MSTDRDTTLAVRSWLDEGVTRLPDRVLDAVLDQVPATPQRRSGWSAWRSHQMNTYARVAAAAAAVLVVAVVGYQFLPRDGGPGGPGPSPTPTLLARGSFETVNRGSVELEAFAVASSVTGHMTVATEEGSFTVDLQCARATADGYLVLGGSTVATTGSGGVLSPVGTYAAVVFRRGSPVRAVVWSLLGGTQEGLTSCAAYLDKRIEEKLRDSVIDSDDPSPIEGTVELAP